MKFDVKVIPGAKHNLVKDEGGSLRVYLIAPLVEGRANQALRELLAEHFGIREADIEIIKGLKSRHKTINIREISQTARNP